MELNRVRDHIEQEYDVIYKSDQSYYDLLAEAGISWKKSQSTNPKADREKVAAKKKK